MTTDEKLDAPVTYYLVFKDSLNGVNYAKAACMKIIAVPVYSNTYNPQLIVADKIINSMSDFNVESIDELF